MTPESPPRLDEKLARFYYRWMMAEDFEEYPWDDENIPSNETDREAREFARQYIATERPDGSFREWSRREVEDYALNLRRQRDIACERLKKVREALGVGQRREQPEDET